MDEKDERERVFRSAYHSSDSIPSSLIKTLHLEFPFTSPTPSLTLCLALRDRIHLSRSPSPEPIYSSDGKRLNTREFRTRKKLEEQRHQLIVRMQCMNPDFKPPTDYK